MGGICSLFVHRVDAARTSRQLLLPAAGCRAVPAAGFRRGGRRPHLWPTFLSQAMQARGTNPAKLSLARASFVPSKGSQRLGKPFATPRSSKTPRVK